MFKAVSSLSLMIRRLEAIVPLPEADLDALSDLPHRLDTWASGSILVAEGELRGQCTVLLSGFAFRQKWTLEGKRQIVSMYVPGDPLDFDRLFLTVRDENIRAATRCNTAVIPRDDLIALSRHRPAIFNAVIASTLVDAAITRERLVDIGRRNGRARVAHLLCEFAVRFKVRGLPLDQGYDLPLNQDEIADALGLTPVHVNRMLKSLEKDGLIKRTGRRFNFPRWHDLCEVADFSSRYLYSDRRT